MSVPTIVSDFEGDLRRQLAIQLQREGYLVTPNQPDQDLCIIWGNVRLRQIPRRPRKTAWSRELQRANVEPSIRLALRRICAASERGKNLNAHLSRKHLNAAFNDLLFNDWRIHHMHLGPRGGKRTGRTEALLFALVTDDVFHLIDVLDHKAFGDVRLVEIVKRNFPKALPLVAAPGIVADGRANLSREERQQSREAGVLCPVEIDGTVYFPAGGLASSGANVRAVQGTDRVRDALRGLERGLHAAPLKVAQLFGLSTDPPPPRLELRLLVGGPIISVVELGSGRKKELFEVTFQR